MSGTTFNSTSTSLAETNPDKDLKLARVLIVEDDQNISDMMCELFSDFGIRCFSIRSKTSAEHFLRHIRPDLVIVDYQLVGGVGLSIARIAFNMDVPVIVISGHSGVFKQVEDEGFNYLQKPFTIGQLLELVSVLIGNDASERGTPA